MGHVTLIYRGLSNYTFVDTISEEDGRSDHIRKMYTSAVIAIIVIMVACTLLCILLPLSQQNILLIIYITLFIGFFVFVYSFMRMNRRRVDSNEPKTNATLTCKNGHRCRVWIRRSRSELLYLGKPIILPITCPECGAEWDVYRRPEDDEKDYYN
jgi:hypothetical protein